MAQVAQRVVDFFAALLRPDHLHFRARPLFSGRAALASGFELNLDQVGLPEEMAWALFGPQVEREIGRADEVVRRSARATEALDATMARKWVLLYSAQRVLVDEGPMSTAVVAFRPQRLAGAAVRVHPRVCRLMELDFDGDSIEVFLPLTEEAQAEAETALSVAGHIQRDADVWRYVADNYHGMTWGLARLWSHGGRPCRSGGADRNGGGWQPAVHQARSQPLARSGATAQGFGASAGCTRPADAARL